MPAELSRMMSRFDTKQNGMNCTISGPVLIDSVWAPLAFRPKSHAQVNSCAAGSGYHIEHKAVLRPEIPEAAKIAFQAVRMIATAALLAEWAEAVESHGKMPEETAHTPGHLLAPYPALATIS